MGAAARWLFQGFLSLFAVSVVSFFLFNVLQKEDSSSDQPEVSSIGDFPSFLADISPIVVISKSALNTDWQIATSVAVTDQLGLYLKSPYLGRSLATGEKVSTTIWDGTLESIVLVFAALFLAIAFGIPSGVFAARGPGGLFDVALKTMSTAGMAIPSFVAALFIAWLFGYWLGDALGLSVTGSLFEYNFYSGNYELVVSNVVLPALALSIRPMSVTAWLTRNSMVQVMQQDYIRTARSKGLSEHVVLFRHALRNALTPVLHEVVIWSSALLVGSVFVEYVFGWKGLGHVLLLAVENKDFPVMIGLTIFSSTVFISMHGLLKVVAPFFDPASAMK